MTEPVGFDGELVAEIDPDAPSDRQKVMYNEMADLFSDSFETFVQKNLDYDSSFLTAGRIEQTYDSGGGPFDSELESNLYKLFTRIQDKNQRFYSLAFDNGDDYVGENLIDTAQDAAVYWMMVTWLLKYGSA